MSRVGSHLELRIDGVAHGGWCVGRHDEQVVFVRHALPGERVRVRVTEETKRFLRGEAVEVLEASADRVEAPCRFAGPGKCGGCDWQHATLDAQRRIKAQVVTEQLRRIAGIEREVTVEELPGTPDGLGWRTRVRFAVDGKGRAGLRRHRSHDLQQIDECLIAHPEVNRLGVPELEWPGIAEVEAVSSGSCADTAVIVTPRGAKLPLLPTPKASAAVLRRFKGGRTQSVRGRRGIRETAGGREYRVSAGSFWQVHPAAAQTLSDAVIDALAPKPGETALDLYCGAGLFAVRWPRPSAPRGGSWAWRATPRRSATPSTTCATSRGSGWNAPTSPASCGSGSTCAWTSRSSTRRARAPDGSSPSSSPSSATAGWPTSPATRRPWPATSWRSWSAAMSWPTCGPSTASR